MKRIRRFTFLICLLGSCILCSTTVHAQTKPLTLQQKKHLVEKIGQRLDRSAFAYNTDFSTWPQIAEKHWHQIENAADRDELALALAEALAEYELSHLSVFSPTRAKLQRQGKRTGIGITVHPDEDGAFVSYVLPASPAADCGIQKGDTIIAIDDEPLKEIEQLVGKLGDKRTLTWIRKGEQYRCDFEYKPFLLSEPSSLKWLRDDIALIKIQSFQYRFYKASRINSFFREARNARAIIIDLRNNRGGLSFYSRHLASKLTPVKTPFALLANRRHTKNLDTPTLDELAASARVLRPVLGSRPYKGKVVVLVDSLSASAADIVPAFLQESGRAIVIGEKTSGALQLARTFQLPYRFRLYAPTAELLTPQGSRLEGNGLEPDITLSLEETASDEIIFAAALQWIDKSD